MSYVKVIASGHVLEVYTYDSEPIKKENKEEDNHKSSIERLKEKYSQKLIELKEWEKTTGLDYSKHIKEELEIIKEQIKQLEEVTKTDRTIERRKQTLRDARNLTRRLALMNFNEDSYFMTLTVKDNINDIELMDKELKKFMKRLKYNYGDYKYLAVREFQKRGAIHYHMMIHINFNLPLIPEGYGHYKRNGKRYKNKIAHKYDLDYLQPLEREVASIWKHGIVDIEPMKENTNVGAYLIKYMTKDVNIDLYKNKKMYLCSKGLERPKEFKGTEAENILKLYNLNDKNYKFTNNYQTEFLGMCNYKEYNLKLIENKA